MVTTFRELVYLFGDFFSIAIRSIIALLFLYLVWKLFDSWVINGGDEKKLEEGKQTALAAVIVFVLLVSVWGIVVLLQKSIFG